MAWTRVQTVGANGAGGTATATISATSAGNLLVAYAAASVVAPVVTDSAGQAYRCTLMPQNVPGGSTKRHGFFWLTTAAGVTSLTVTGSTNVYIQVAEYDPGVATANYSMWPGSESEFTVASGLAVGGTLEGSAPAGNLELMGVTANATAVTTWTIGTGITTLVGTGNQVNGSATIALGETLSCAASPVGNFTLSPSNSVGSIAAVFVPYMTDGADPGSPPALSPSAVLGLALPVFADPVSSLDSTLPDLPPTQPPFGPALVRIPPPAAAAVMLRSTADPTYAPILSTGLPGRWPGLAPQSTVLQVRDVTVVIPPDTPPVTLTPPARLTPTSAPAPAVGWTQRHDTAQGPASVVRLSLPPQTRTPAAAVLRVVSDPPTATLPTFPAIVLPGRWPLAAALAQVLQVRDVTPLQSSDSPARPLVVTLVAGTANAGVQLLHAAAGELDAAPHGMLVVSAPSAPGRTLYLPIASPRVDGGPLPGVLLVPVAGARPTVVMPAWVTRLAGEQGPTPEILVAPAAALYAPLPVRALLWAPRVEEVGVRPLAVTAAAVASGFRPAPAVLVAGLAHDEPGAPDLVLVQVVPGRAPAPAGWLRRATPEPSGMPRVVVAGVGILLARTAPGGWLWKDRFDSITPPFTWRVTATSGHRRGSGATTGGPVAPVPD